MRRSAAVSILTFLGVLSWVLFPVPAGATHATFIHKVTWGQVGVIDAHCPAPQTPETCESNADMTNQQQAASADGRLVAQAGSAGNLVPVAEDGSRSYNTFLTSTDPSGDGILGDPEDFEMWVVDVSLVTGLASRGPSGCPGISAGTDAAGMNWVVFWSASSDLVAGDTNAVADIFVRAGSLAGPSGDIVRVNVASDGTQGNGASGTNAFVNCPSISEDGRYVAYQSAASNLVAGDTNAVGDIFVRDRDTDTDGVYDEAGAVATTRVSVASDGTQANGASTIAGNALSWDGMKVAFTSAASNLVAGDTNGRVDAFVHDMATGSTTRVSATSAGSGASPGTAGMSPDGGTVGFVAARLLAADTNGRLDNYAIDLATGAVARMSVATDGSQGTANSVVRPPSFDFDAGVVCFETNASLDPNDTTKVQQPGGAPLRQSDVYCRFRDTDGDGIFDEAGAVKTVFVSLSTSDPHDVDLDGNLDEELAGVIASGVPSVLPFGLPGASPALVFTTGADNVPEHDHNHHGDVTIAGLSV